MPAYQRQAVASYLQQNAAALPPSYSYNAHNRAYPDVAALGNNVPVVMQGTSLSSPLPTPSLTPYLTPHKQHSHSSGQTLNFGGTSASTPEVAGIISLINDHRLNTALPPLGFVNTRLYNIAAQHPGNSTFIYAPLFFAIYKKINYFYRGSLL